MDELSWRARLAKSNINILDIHGNRAFVEFTYHPKPNVFKWCKTYFELPEVYDTYAALVENELKTAKADDEVLASIILNKVLELRKELEG